MRNLLPIIFISAVGLVVRCLTADWGSLSSDEANGIAIATTGTWADMIQHLKEDGNAPLFYALIRLISHWFGSADFTLRLLSMCISSSLVPIVYWLLRGDRLLALQSASLIALCPTLIRYGNLVRMYSILPILSFTSTYFAIRLMHEPANKKLRIAVPCLSALLIYCHPWGFFVLLGQAGLALWGLYRRWWTPGTLLPWCWGMALSALAYLPWAPILHHVLRHIDNPFGTPPPSFLLVETPPQALIGYLSPSDTWAALAMIYSTLWVLFLVFCPGFSVNELRRPRVSAETAATSGSWPDGGAHTDQKLTPTLLVVACLRYVVIAGLVGALLESSLRPAWRDRYLAATFTPMLLVLFCLMLRRFAPAKHSIIAVCLPAMMWLPSWIPQLIWLAEGSESSAHTIAAKILSTIDRKNDLVVVSYEAAVPAISRLLPEEISLISFPDMERVTIVKWEGLKRRIKDDSRMKELFQRMEKVLGQGGTIWLVDAERDTCIPGLPGKFPLDRFRFQELEAVREDQVRNWLHTYAQQQGIFLWGPGRDLSLYLSVYKPKPANSEATPPKPMQDEWLLDPTLEEQL